MYFTFVPTRQARAGASMSIVTLARPNPVTFRGGAPGAAGVVAYRRPVFLLTRVGAGTERTCFSSRTHSPPARTSRASRTAWSFASYSAAVIATALPQPLGLEGHEFAQLPDVEVAEQRVLVAVLVLDVVVGLDADDAGEEDAEVLRVLHLAQVVPGGHRDLGERVGVLDLRRGGGQHGRRVAPGQPAEGVLARLRPLDADGVGQPVLQEEPPGVDLPRPLRPGLLDALRHDHVGVRRELDHVPRGRAGRQPGLRDVPPDDFRAVDALADVGLGQADESLPAVGEGGGGVHAGGGLVLE